MSTSISLILDLNSKDLQQHRLGNRFMMILFQAINLRFCGFQTFDISLFATATLLVYILLMATKPQMLCVLDESPFEIYWLTLEAQGEVEDETNLPKSKSQKLQRALSIVSGANPDAVLYKYMQQFLHRQSIVTKTLAKTALSRNFVHKSKSSHSKHSNRIRILRLRLFLIHFIRASFKHTFNFFLLTRTWLFVFIFLICAIEYRRMAPADPDITIFKITFEIISAFGCTGMSLGYPNKTTSFASVLSPASQILLIITMLMGRHRGLLASMKDQEVNEYSATKVLNRQRQEYVVRHQKSQAYENSIVTSNYTESMIAHF